LTEGEHQVRKITKTVHGILLLLYILSKDIEKEFYLSFRIYFLLRKTKTLKSGSEKAIETDSDFKRLNISKALCQHKNVNINVLWGRNSKYFDAL